MIYLALISAFIFVCVIARCVFKISAARIATAERAVTEARAAAARATQDAARATRYMREYRRFFYFIVLDGRHTDQMVDEYRAARAKARCAIRDRRAAYADVAIAKCAYFALAVFSSGSIEKPRPPACAQYLLELLASPELSEAAAGDFFEKYERKFYRVRSKHGVRLAKLDYWWQVLRSAPGLLQIRVNHLAVFAGLAKVFHIVEKYWAPK